MKNYLILTLILVFVMACDNQKVFEDYRDFEEVFWHQDSVVSFTFEIVDSSQPYNLIAQFRNSLQYPYHNMYYQYTLKDDSDSTLSQELMEIFLFDPRSGNPYGSGLGDYFDNSQMVLDTYNFPASGSYSVDIKQYMRLDTLPFLMSVGWRVETVEQGE